MPPPEPKRSPLPPQGATLPGDNAAPDPLAGGVAGPPGYEVLSELGRGGMGVVYRARQLALSRDVALKMVLAGRHAGEDERRRFLREAEVIARVRHPGIVQVYDYGTHDGVPFFSMELLDGGSLADRLDGTPLPPRDAAAVVEQVATAVQAAHDAGVVHRDLKPGNVLLVGAACRAAPESSPAGWTYPAKITDFGSAKRVEGGGLTRTGAILGTPSYMAPEQAQGQKDVGPLADVYALGAILYECLTGRPPFRAATAFDTLMQVVRDEPVPVRRLNAGVPPDLETICHSCLRKDPARRYASAAAVAGDLRRYLDGRPITARPAGPAERLWRWCRRNPAVAASLLAGTVAALALAMAVVAASYNSRLTAERDEAERQRRRAEEQEELGRRYLYASRIDLAHRAWRDAELARMRDLMDEQRPIGEADHGFEWRYLNRLLRGVPAPLEGHTGFVVSVAYRPDGRQLASGGGDGTVRVWDAVTGRAERVLNHGGSYVGVAYSPDGGRLAAASHNDNTLRVWDTKTWAVLRTLSFTGQGWHAPAFSPDGHLLATRVIQPDHEAVVKVWEVSTGRELHHLRAATPQRGRASFGGPRFSPDGRRLASTCNGERFVTVWDLDTGKPALSIRNGFEVRAIDFSPDGEELMAAGGFYGHVGMLQAWDARKGTFLRFEVGHSHLITGVAYSPDGRNVVTSSADRTVQLWSRAPLKVRATYRGHAMWIHDVAVHPKGEPQVATASRDRTVRLWPLEAVPATTLAGRSGGLAVSPDGKTFASAGEVGTIHFWDLEREAFLGPGVMPDPIALGGLAGLLATPAGWGPLLAAAALFLDRPNRLDSPTYAVAFAPEGDRVVSRERGGAVRLWDVRSRRLLRALQPGYDVPPDTNTSHQAHSVAYSPAGRLVASAGPSRTVRVWDVRDGREALALPGGHVLAVAFSPDGKRLATGGVDGVVRLWASDDGQPLGDLAGHRGAVFALAFDRDGRLASAGADHTIRLWDAAGGPVRTFVGHNYFVQGVAFSPDGRRLASASSDQTVKLWDVSTGQEVLTLDQSAGWYNAVAFRPDGNMILASSAEGAIRLWDAGPR